jgi:hypothetical protein
MCPDHRDSIAIGIVAFRLLLLDLLNNAAWLAPVQEAGVADGTTVYVVRKLCRPGA